MNDEEKTRARRRVYWPLRLLLVAKVFTNDVMKLNLVIAKGDFDPEAIYNELKDAKAKLTADLDEVMEKVCETIWFESTSKPTLHNFEEWKRIMAMRRHTKQILERRKERSK